MILTFLLTGQVVRLTSDLRVEVRAGLNMRCRQTEPEIVIFLRPFQYVLCNSNPGQTCCKFKEFLLLYVERLISIKTLRIFFCIVYTLLQSNITNNTYYSRFHINYVPIDIDGKKISLLTPLDQCALVEQKPLNIQMIIFDYWCLRLMCLSLFSMGLS